MKERPSQSRSQSHGQSATQAAEAFDEGEESDETDSEEEEAFDIDEWVTHPPQCVPWFKADFT